MSTDGRYRIWLTLAVVAALALAGAVLTLTPPARRGRKAPEPTTSTQPPIDIDIYTNPGATTPQIPLWSALEQKTPKQLFAPTVRVWKTAAHLQSVLLAGEGDVWIGHIDGFARARARGAPVRLLAVSGWRKFALVSTDPQITGFTDFNGQSLAYAPTGCPSVDILTAVLGEDIGRVDFVPHEPKQLALMMVQGKVENALLPEPLVTVLLEKMAGLRVVVNVEDVYARLNEGNARMPIAGIAVHDRLVRDHPKAVGILLKAVIEAASRLAANPETAPEVLPEQFADFVPRHIVRASLKRDVILVKSADDAADEVRRYLRVVTPELFEKQADLPDGFFVRLPPTTPEKG